MLFRALIDRMFGTNERLEQKESVDSVTPSRLSYNKYPSLLPLLVRLLGGSVVGDNRLDQVLASPSSGRAELIFPALEILRRCGLPINEEEVVVPLVTGQLGSRMWHVREMAARTLCALVTRGGYVDLASRLMSMSLKGSNHQHGALLALKFLLEKYLQKSQANWQG